MTINHRDNAGNRCQRFKQFFDMGRFTIYLAFKAGALKILLFVIEAIGRSHSQQTKPRMIFRQLFPRRSK
ncbi:MULTISPECIES: hypothetical protein [Thalassospira]|uniref:Uncharacterized protein n=1 Tax=Thalassospira profundimaris TaxID=502049 RepID=A0A367VIT0_9PROT|nr:MULTISPECIES: hypothetical protein [Thalassospira]KZB71205.1 hypothetical protein AUQ43_10400 [Thalassospira sp. MCCC 1A01148]RCK25128.1 hypothetical protein TH6_00380 [Thalassospira profundimaris]